MNSKNNVNVMKTLEAEAPKKIEGTLDNEGTTNMEQIEEQMFHLALKVHLREDLELSDYKTMVELSWERCPEEGEPRWVEYLIYKIWNTEFDDFDWFCGVYSGPRIRKREKMEPSPAAMIGMFSKDSEQSKEGMAVLFQKLFSDPKTCMVTTYVSADDAARRRQVEPFVQETLEKIEGTIIQLLDCYPVRDSEKAASILSEYVQLFISVMTAVDGLEDSTYIYDMIDSYLTDLLGESADPCTNETICEQRPSTSLVEEQPGEYCACKNPDTVVDKLEALALCFGDSKQVL